jgi:hypothetical protein
MTTIRWGTRADLGSVVRRGRGYRVVAILCAVLLLSLGDLYMTVEHLTSVGMFEQNPVARAVMGAGSTLALTLWKLCTVGLGLAILYRARRTAWGEMGAWVCLLALLWLTVRWALYADAAPGMTPYIHALADSHGAGWVSFAP